MLSNDQDLDLNERVQIFSGRFLFIKALYGWAANDGRPVCHTPKIPQNSHMTQLADCT